MLFAALLLPLAPAPDVTDGWKPSPAAEALLWQYAACVVRHEGDLARAVLDTEPLTPDAQRRTLDVFQKSKCVYPGTMKANHAVVRWALAEQLYLAGGRTAPAATPVPPRVAPGEAYALGACVAQRDPADADAFVRTKRRSRAEKAAFKRLIPPINGCAGKSKIVLSGAAMHGVLAEGLYRMRGATAQGSN